MMYDAEITLHGATVALEFHNISRPSKITADIEARHMAEVVTKARIIRVKITPSSRRIEREERARKCNEALAAGPELWARNEK